MKGIETGSHTAQAIPKTCYVAKASLEFPILPSLPKLLKLYAYHCAQVTLTLKTKNYISPSNEKNTTLFHGYTSVSAW